MIVNPYTPPSVASERIDDRGYALRSLRRASTLYTWMGWIGIAYFCVAYPAGLLSAVLDPPFRLGVIIGMSVMTALFTCLFGSMIRLGSHLQTDLAVVYSRARWTGILVGAFGFPFLTIPAFYAVRLISRAHSAKGAGDERSDARMHGDQLSRIDAQLTAPADPAV